MKIRYIVLFILLLACGMAFATDPWGEPTVLTGSMTVMAQVSINGAPAASGDALGAFVTVGGNPQLRGKALVQVVGGIAGCLIQIYTETNGETISFKVWDESASMAFDATQTLPSEVNGIVGSYPDNMYQITAGQTQITDPWPDPTVLTGSMTVMAQVSINGTPAVQEDILGAFVTVGGNEQLRGKANIMVNSGIAGCLIQIYTENNGEAISFKVWDFSEQEIMSVAQTLPSEVNGIVGSWPDNLYQINGTGTVQQVATPTFNPVAGIYTTAQSVSIACTTPGAEIRYTTNGNDPTETSTLYSAPIAVAVSTTIKAKAFLTGWTASLVATASYVITGTVATPTFNPPAGTYTSTQTVAISSTTPDAQIRYTTNGTDPTESSMLYTAPLSVAATTTIKAKAYKLNWTPSAIATALYTITGTVATPTFTPAQGTYATAQNVSIACTTPAAQIRYTTDGTEPTATSPLYSTPINCPLNTTTTIKAKGFLTGWTPSATATGVYVITGTVATPTFNPPAGTYTSTQTVAITCTTAGSQIRYTVDGTEPTATSTLYSNPITVSVTTTVKAKGFKTDWTPSPTATALYTITGTVATPTFNPVQGTYQTAQNVTIACATPGAQIRYTTDGTEPTATSTLYSAPIACPLNTTTTIKAKGFLTGWTPSATATGVYVITGTVAIPTFTPAQGTYQTAQNVAIACTTPGAQIRYTTDGTEPTATSTLYSAPIACPLGTTTTIKAKGFKTDWTPSPTATGVYVITGTVATPTFDPPAGTYQGAVNVAISCATPAAQIRYTTDGTEPTATSTLYAAPLNLMVSTTLKAKAFKTDWTPSATATAEYVVETSNPEEPSVPVVTGISQVYPNPFSASTTIVLGIKEANQGYRIKIYNIKGECVYRTQGMAKGMVELAWNGSDDTGRKLPAGIYFISFQSGDTSQTRKLVLK